MDKCRKHIWPLDLTELIDIFIYMCKLLLFLTVIYSCIVHVGQKPTRACVALLFKYAD